MLKTKYMIIKAYNPMFITLSHLPEIAFVAEPIRPIAANTKEAILAHCFLFHRNNPTMKNNSAITIVMIPIVTPAPEVVKNGKYADCFFNVSKLKNKIIENTSKNKEHAK